MGQKPKGCTELKVYYELTFVTLGHLQELVWSFTFFSTSDPISAHILNILHWFFNRKMPLGVLKSIESLLYHWGSIEELNWSLHGSSSVCSWKTPFQSKCDNLPQQHLFYTLLYVYSKHFDELGQLYELIWSFKNPCQLYSLGHYSRSYCILQLPLVWNWTFFSWKEFFLLPNIRNAYFFFDWGY